MILSFLKSRPLTSATALYLLALFLILFFRPPWILWVSLFLSPFLLFFLVVSLTPLKKRLSPRFSSLAFLVFLLLLSLFLPTLIGGKIASDGAYLQKTYHEKDADITVTIESVKSYGSVTTAYGKTLTVNGDRAAYSVVLTFFEEAIFEEPTGRHVPLSRGDTFSGRFTLSVIDGDDLKDLWQFADGCQLDGVYLENGIVTAHGHRSLKTLSGDLSDIFSRLIDDHLGDHSRALMKALMLADNSALEKEDLSALTTLGISHLLAVSGLHLTILIGAVASLFHAFSLDRRLFYPLLAFLTLLYAVITGFAPSLLRAGGMLLLFYLSFYIRRKKDTLTSLLAATAVITFISPRSVLDLGLLLSFGATFGILVIGTPLSNAFNRRLDEKTPNRFAAKSALFCLKALAPSIIVTLSATVTILPFLMLSGGNVFLLAPLTNLLFSPLFNGLLYLFPIFLLTCKIPIISSITALIAEGFSFLIFQLLKMAEIFSPFSISLAYDFLPFLFLVLALLSGILLLRKRKAAAAGVLALFFVLTPLSVHLHERSLEKTCGTVYLTNGSGDVLLVEDGRRRAMIVFSTSRSFGEDAFFEEAFSSPSTLTDTLILPDPQNAHAALLKALADEASLKHLVLTNAGASSYLATYAKELGLTVSYIEAYDTLLYNHLPITFYPSSDGKLRAVTVTLPAHRTLYLTEPAPNDFDIRFGVMKESFDTVILGGYGSDTKGALAFDVADVWASEDKNVIRLQKGQTIIYGNNAYHEKKDID